MRKTYPTDLSDEEWSYIEPQLPAPNAPGRPRLHTLREVLDAIFYILRSGCAWRLLPNDFPTGGSDDEVGRGAGQRAHGHRPEGAVAPEGPGPFSPRRWVVERTFSCSGQNRRLSKDYERLPKNSEAFIHIATSRLMARRLARS